MVSKLSKLKPVGIDIEFKVEDEKGEEKIEKIRVYPLKIKEQVELQQLAEQEKREETAVKLIYYALRSSLPDITEEEIKDFPTSWSEEVTKAIFKLQGIDYDKLKTEKKETLQLKT